MLKRMAYRGQMIVEPLTDCPARDNIRHTMVQGPCGSLTASNSLRTDTRTLTRAARDFVEEQPQFACNAGLLALHWISMGHGYEITGKDVLDAYAAVMKAASVAGTETDVINAAIWPMYAAHDGQFLKKILGRHVPGV